jgi:glyoxylase-like metal-dependent hydrolase (beta-lactamase superfamily II)
MLKHIKGGSYYFDARQAIGIYIKDNKAILIDTGIDEDYSRKVYNALNEKNIKITSIINTHSHGDHYGGNNLIKQRSNCVIYAPETEATVMENPLLEPIYLFGGEPINELKDKFFMANPSKIDVVIKEEKEIEGLKIVRVPGHSFNMINIATPDNVLYAADSFFSEEVLKKYKIPYLFNVEKTLNSLKLLLESDYDFFVLAHGGLLDKEQAKMAISKNIGRINDVAKDIESFLEEKSTAEGILKFLSEKYDLFVHIGQYFLNMSIVKAYLSYLKSVGKISCFIEGKMLYWKKN